MGVFSASSSPSSASFLCLALRSNPNLSNNNNAELAVADESPDRTSPQKARGCHPAHHRRPGRRRLAPFPSHWVPPIDLSSVPSGSASMPWSPPLSFFLLAWRCRLSACEEFGSKVQKNRGGRMQSR
ncbi:unnamed protein product [Linum trigynum]|uniref:Uncharacterized protein n=1 Tax=Linum trigynum TaxID=586398 RepID=A0AAV2EW29_9ROSI